MEPGEATATAARHPRGAWEHLQTRWPEYLIEAALLGLFMASACSFGVILFHPDSAMVAAVPNPALRRMLMGLAMGSTAAALIYSPWGKQSGAHFNPAVTITFFRLGKVAPWDAVFYPIFQFCGGVLGVLAVAAVLRQSLADPEVNFVVTVPGRWGVWPAFAAEIIISCVLMLTILIVTNSRLSTKAGLFGACLVATYITLESPISGMSMNPARTVASAAVAGVWTSAWIYFIAPLLGMLAAAQLYLSFSRRGVGCAKWHHDNNKRCIFCAFQQSQQPRAAA